MTTNGIILLLLLMLSAHATWSAAAKTTKPKVITSTSSSISSSSSSSSLSSASASAKASSTASIPSSQLPLEARNGGDASEEDEMIATSYVLPNQIFNDGKPYYAGKDPISGQLDFSAKKPAGIETAANEVYDPKEKIVLSNTSPNIHDFLNLPVKYSSSKFVYPLVSSSYANLKYQGNNKNYMTNKKPTSVEAPVTAIPSLPATTSSTINSNNNNNAYYTIPTTKLMAVAPTTSTTATTATTATRGTIPTKGSTTAATTATTITSTTTTTTTTTTASSSSTTSKKPFTAIKLPPRPPSVATRYTTSTRKPIPISTGSPEHNDDTSSTSSTTASTPTATTRKKFVPTKKYQLTGTTPTTTATTPIVSSTPPASPVRFPDTVNTTTTTTTANSSSGSGSGSTAAPKPITTTTGGGARPRPTPPTPATATISQQRVNASAGVSDSHRPVIFTEPSTAPPSFSALPAGGNGGAPVPTLDAGDVYQTLGNKHTDQQALKPQPQPQAHPKPKPPMSLADLFNSMAEEDAALASNGGVFDAQGNLVQPIAPSKPSPFAMQGQSPPAQRPSLPKFPPRPHQHPTRPHQHGTTPQELISGSQENFSNEYVSYQVQQPNMLQYRPVPGAINNVVISPGQHSASFVLGSQQQVGIGGSVNTGGSVFGSVEKESLFGASAKKPNVQYGTVINEDIASVATANGHQNGRPNSVYPSEPPAAPSPYQQLPLVNSNKRPKPQKHTERPLPTALPQQGTTPSLMSTLATAQPSQSPPSAHMPHSTPQLTPQQPQELLVSSSVRFPPPGELDRSEELPSGPVAAGPPVEPHVNGHAQPLSLQQIQNSNPVVFPKPHEEQGASPVSDVQVQQHDVITMNQHKQKLTFPQNINLGGPAQHMEPPPPAQPGRFPPNELSGDAPPKRPLTYSEYSRKPQLPRPNHDRAPLPNILPQFRPNAKVSSGHVVSSANYNHEPGNIRVPAAGGQPSQLKRPHPPPPPPQFAHRRQPLRYPYNNNNRPLDFGSLSAEAANNRRVYRLPPYGGAYAQRPALGPPPPQPPLPTPAQLIRTVDAYTTIERHAPERLAAFEEEDLVINDPPQPMTASKDMQHMDETKLEPVVTLQMLQSQKKGTNSNQLNGGSTDEDDNNAINSNDTGVGEIQVPAASGEGSEQPNGLYVVYPMKNAKLVGDSNAGAGAAAAADADAAEEAKDHLSSIQVETSSASNYQNTPFTVVRDEPQEPILKELKHKQQPQSLQQQTKQSLAAKEKFPYPIEKPDPAFTDLQPQVPPVPHVPGVLIAPRIINGAIGAESKMAPIAIAYTPTEPNPYRRYSNVNLATPVINEIRRGGSGSGSGSTDTQTEQTLKLSGNQQHYINHNNNEFDIRTQYFEKDFMAPFYPSVSLDGQSSPTDAISKPTNGWNILPVSGSLDDSDSSGATNGIMTDQTQLYAKNQIDRADVQPDDDDTTVANGNSAPSSAADTTTSTTSTTATKPFELDHFQPELQGGFKPIYPPGYKIDNDEDDVVNVDVNGQGVQAQLSEANSNAKPLALASHMPAPNTAPQQPQQEQQQVISSNSSNTTVTNLSTPGAPTQTTSTTSTPKPTISSSSSSSSTIPPNTSSSSSTTITTTSTTTAMPLAAVTPTQRKKSVLETSLEALLFGDDTDFTDDDDGESRQQKQTSNSINGGARPLHMVPRMGPRSLKLGS